MSNAGTLSDFQARSQVTEQACRWDDDVIFKNQARGTEDKGKKKEFVNVSICVFGEDLLLICWFRIC